MTSSLSDLRQSPAEEKVFFPASFAQQRLWFIDQLAPGRATYNIPSALRIRGKLDVEVLTRTLEEVVRRHESLRTRFVAVGGEPQQVIEDQVNVQLPVLDLTGVAGEEEREAEARRLAREEAQQPFDLQQAPLMRGKLLRLGGPNHVLLFTMHHIISDAWSMGVLIEEVSILYDAFSGGRSSPLPELPIQYADYSVWQRECLEGGMLEQQLAYWKQQLAGVSMLQLPTDWPRPTALSQSGALCNFVIEANITSQLKKLAQEQGATLFMALLAAFQALLCRYTRQCDIAVGTPIAGRSSSDTEKLIGFFVNTLVLRVDLAGAPSFIELLQRVKKVTLEAYAHQDISFEKLVEVLSPERSLGSTPLFQVMIGLQNAPQSDLRLGAAELQAFNTVDNGTSKFDLLLQVGEDGTGKLAASLQYNTDLFAASSVGRMTDHFRMLLIGIVTKPSQSIDAFPLLTTEEHKQVIEEWNRTTIYFPQEKCIPCLIEEQVVRTPEAVAVECEKVQLRYHELNARANQLAWWLRELGVGPETRVGLMVERSLEMVVAMLGVLKAGGAYVPLDARYPKERLRWMLEDTQPAVLLTHSSMETLLSPFAGKIIRLDRERDEINRRSRKNLTCEVSGNNLAYALYTSGSTGRPKAVGIRHSSAALLVKWAQEVFSVEELSGVLASTSICFDLSVYEIFAPLSCGGKVIVAGNVLELAEIPAREQVKLVNTVPSAMQELLRSQGLPRSVVTVNLAGEVLTTNLVKQLYELKSIKRVLNLYGPSEDTTYSTYAWIKKEEVEATGRATASIGRPIMNTQAYVVDKRMEPVPIGVAGRAVYRWGGIGTRISEPARIDSRAFCAGSIREPEGDEWRAAVSNRGPGAMAARREPGVPRPIGSSGQDSRIPH